MPLEEKKEQNNRERNEKKRFEAHRRMVTEKLFSRVDFTEGKVMKKKKSRSLYAFEAKGKAFELNARLVCIANVFYGKRKEWIEKGEEKKSEGGRNGGGWEERIRKGRNTGEMVRGKSRETSTHLDGIEKMS